MTKKIYTTKAIYEGRSNKFLQLDYIEEWKCYKLNFIFQYNL